MENKVSQEQAEEENKVSQEQAGLPGPGAVLPAVLDQEQSFLPFWTRSTLCAGILTRSTLCAGILTRSSLSRGY